MSSTAMRGNSSDSSSPEQSVDRESDSDEVSEEEDDVSKETQNAPFPSGALFSALVLYCSNCHSKSCIRFCLTLLRVFHFHCNTDDELHLLMSDSYGQEQQNVQQGVSNVLPRNEQTLGQVPLELVGHSIACAPNPYCDPYYSGMMAAYGQPLVHPQFLDMHQARMPLPLEMAQEPVYVNAKQYHAILRRRQSRAKAELEKKLIKDRKPYLHESRHQHAMRRVRGSGGRFAKKTEVDSLKRDEDKNTTASGSAISSQSVNSTGIKRVRSESAESLDSHKETRRDRLVNSLRYNNEDNYQPSGYHLDRGGGDGGSLGQQWISISSNQASQRAVAMK